MFDVISIVVLVYVIAMQVHLLVLTVWSIITLRRDRFGTQFGRLEDMLSSDLSPPVSIIVPAYNEEAGIAEAVRSMAMLQYPKFEIVVVNDGSSDYTLERLVDRFRLVEVTMPHRNEIETEAIRAVYRSSLPLPITVVDKENGGKTDALNAGTNVARYPYVLLTDADVILEGDCLLRAMRHVVEDRQRTIAIGGNIRPLNGCKVKHGKVVETGLPESLLERVQVLEYIRSFLSARPAWSTLGALPLISGAFGIYRRDILTEVGGFAKGHLGEDLDLTMRLHRHMRLQNKPYRIVYAPDAVCWTEVPTTRKVLRRQRIRWHAGLTMVVKDYWRMLFNPRFGTFGMFGWPGFFLFEYVAPVVEFAGYLVIPPAYFLGWLNTQYALWLLGISFFVGAINSLISLFLDEAFGYFNRPSEAIRLMSMVFLENLGLRQQTVWWRIRSLFGGESTKTWGNMQRQGVANLN